MSEPKRRPVAVLPGWTEKRTSYAALPADVRQPAPWDDSDQRALKALRDGTATTEQQHRALGWIMFATGYRRQPFMTTDRDTSFACGMRHLGIQIYDMLEAAVRGSADDEQGQV